MKKYTVSCPPRPQVTMEIKADSEGEAGDKFWEALDEQDDMLLLIREEKEDKSEERDLSELSESDMAQGGEK